MSGNRKPHIIVLGNEKGGAGKTTTSMHVISSLLYDGYAVSSIDLDSRQRSLSNYLENRKKYTQTHQVELPSPSHYIINNSRLDSQVEGNLDEQKRFEECLKRASLSSDFIVVDSPGNDTYLSRLAHSYADTIVTPINDSFVDLNVLAKVNEDDLRVDRHGVYSEMVWEAKIYRAQRDKGEIDWVVLRNRLTNIDAKNKRKVAEALNNFSKRVRCRLAEGFSERVIYRELFLQGLTLLDLASDKVEFDMKMSHVAARQELRKFMDFLQLEKKFEAAAVNTQIPSVVATPTQNRETIAA
ncbi:MAG: division plane positioning ATPase MipZ [Rickettsiales bacterium]|nr:AAA family ATPase [Pseudomonadota bacterium]MDA0965787.1 AAA family ATPase [Pseudomonadota bacterium]MDG4543751.1 division plane positioning ATPase MipZ [Rickettsiales bacterium]MDG4545898.1 division plane positioning ATPase MipZ [Rickettsiales bacterium]MDG4548144.1 division plane positioning ATPase MipZ [Rickettsiales bacterium]